MKESIKNIIEPIIGNDAALETIHIDAGTAYITLQVDPARGSALEDIRLSVERAVADHEGIQKAQVVLTAEKKRTQEKAAPDPHGINKVPRLENLPIKKIIVVGSGKGGVGKSTIAANLAVSFKKQGLKVGILDADIYGPSQPTMFGLSGKKPKQKDKRIIPLEKNGIKIMSVGFLVDQSQAVIWRGPMVQTALIQLFRDVKWGDEKKPLDVLIVDLPPGTGDVQLTLAQKVPVDGAVIVSTPQDIAWIDARKAIAMFEKTGVPVLGFIENMSPHICSNCGHEEHIFGHGGAAKEAEKLGVKFLGDIPLSIDLRVSMDKGKPAGLPDGIAETIARASGFLG